MSHKTVLFILSLGHSGSTLVGCVLGGHARAIHIGEVIAPLRQGRPVRCRYCWERPCPVWGGVLGEDFVRRCHRSAQAASRSAVKRVARGLVLRLRGDTEPPGALHRALFEGLPDLDVVVDGSKRIPWADWNRRAPDLRSRFLILHRDLRAVVASARRSRGAHIGRGTRRAVARLRALNAFADAQPAGSVHVMRYEDFARDLETHVGRLCDWLELEFDPAMLRYDQFPHHLMGGNLGPVIQARSACGLPVDHLLELLPEHLRQHYLDSGRSIRLDERWRDELDARQLREFEAIGAPVNRQLGYLD